MARGSTLLQSYRSIHFLFGLLFSMKKNNQRTYTLLEEWILFTATLHYWCGPLHLTFSLINITKGPVKCGYLLSNYKHTVFIL